MIGRQSPSANFALIRSTSLYVCLCRAWYAGNWLRDGAAICNRQMRPRCRGFLSSNASNAWNRSRMPLVKSQRSTPRPTATSAPMRYRSRTVVRQVAISGNILQPARRPLDRYRVGSHAAHVTLQSDRHVLMIDLALHETIHGVQEILAMVARVKAEDVGRQHVQQHLALPRTHAECLGVRPRDVPEQHDGGLGNFRADELRQ